MFVTRRKYNKLMEAADVSCEYYRDLWKDMLSKNADLAMKARAFEEQFLKAEEEVARVDTELEITKSALKAAERAISYRENIQHRAVKVLQGEPLVMMKGRKTNGSATDV